MKIKVSVKPSAKISTLIKTSENNYVANIKSPPSKNKANSELIRILAKEFSVPQSKIKIKTPSSRHKIIEISS